MPTPIRAFIDVAAQYGDIDPGDAEAIQHWFSEVLPNLPPATIEEILETLLEHDGTGDEHSTRPAYPRDVPLPSLSSSPPAEIPLLAAGLREILIRLTGRSKKPPRSD
jgi:hypothetical protein